VARSTWISFPCQERPQVNMYTMLVNLSAINDSDLIDVLFRKGECAEIAVTPPEVQGQFFQCRATASTSAFEWNARLPTSQAIAAVLANHRALVHLAWLPSSDNTRFARAFFLDFEAFREAVKNIKWARDWMQYQKLYATYPILLVGVKKTSCVEPTRMVQIGTAVDAAELAATFAANTSQFAIVFDEFDAERAAGNALIRGAVSHKINGLDWFVVPGDLLELMHVLIALNRASIIARDSVANFLAFLHKGMEIEYALTRVKVGIGANLYGTSGVQVYARDTQLFRRISLVASIEFWI
jgi:hypothetical protein